jgi:ferric-dicitrate binding protein FerR (iron transport regulator)
MHITDIKALQMDQNSDIKNLIGRLYKKEFLSAIEIRELDKWLSGLKNDQTFEAWLQLNWQSAEDIPVEISFDEIRRLIYRNAEKPSGKRIFLQRFQRVAAILILPLLIFSAVLIYQNFNTPENWLSIKTAKGERTHITLPDGSEVWLNVDTELKYSVAYNQRNRNIKLNGEAFFKVAKNRKKDFVVETRNFSVKAVGTEFGVNAYASEPFAETYLKEGIVDVSLAASVRNKIRMKPGQKSIIESGASEILLQQSQNGSESEWTGGQLVFQNEDIPRVFRKIERWFNVSIKYNPEEFSRETLYVNLKSGETLEKMLQIIDNAIGIQVKRNGNELLIEKKIKRANS